MPFSETIGVLILDDEASEIQTIRRILESEHRFKILTAETADEALEIVTSHSDEVQLALLDVALPKDNGVEVAKRLLRLKPDLRVLFISGHVGASVIRFYGMDAGDEYFLQKPFDGATLLRRMQKVLDSTGPLRWTEKIAAASDSAV
jgi:DNA-binding response OmpR family regulator